MPPADTPGLTAVSDPSRTRSSASPPYPRISARLRLRSTRKNAYAATPNRIATSRASGWRTKIHARKDAAAPTVRRRAAHRIRASGSTPDPRRPLASAFLRAGVLPNHGEREAVEDDEGLALDARHAVEGILARGPREREARPQALRAVDAEPEPAVPQPVERVLVDPVTRTALPRSCSACSARGGPRESGSGPQGRRRGSSRSAGRGRGAPRSPSA